jgi:hypothetical protein
MNLHRRAWLFAWICSAAASVVACGWRQEPPKPVATPGFAAGHSRVPLGSPVELTYRFVVAPDAPPFTENYRVFVHFLDSDDELMWTDDHSPAVPTTQWKPGQTVEYTRTMFVPVYPYLGGAAVEMGLYSPSSSTRLPLAGEDHGQRSYRVGRLELLPQTENVFVIFRDGWHGVETAEDNAAIEWQWTRKDATLSVRNPKRDVILYLHLDHPGGVFEEPQQVEVTLAGQPVDTFTLHPKEELIRKIPLTAAQLGPADMVEVKIHVDKTFVPALVSGGRSTDVRELGVRVFHAFVEPQGAQ